MKLQSLSSKNKHLLDLPAPIVQPDHNDESDDNSDSDDGEIEKYLDLDSNTD